MLCVQQHPYVRVIGSLAFFFFLSHRWRYPGGWGGEVDWGRGPLTFDPGRRSSLEVLRRLHGTLVNVEAIPDRRGFSVTFCQKHPLFTRCWD